MLQDIVSSWEMFYAGGDSHVFLSLRVCMGLFYNRGIIFESPERFLNEPFQKLLGLSILKNGGELKVV